ncbi:MAG: outer membrane protein assembly factor BamD [Ignavibacteriales bacterium]|nr:outer membrane protein assembly factor BamD [Ignavibacteriota bacterium]MCB9249562.1 outer membrane protein assembly factor BamD [Ignavibacteriales bacterium]
MKKILIIFLSAILLWNCSSSIDTTTLTAEQHLEYAKNLMTDGDYEEAIREFHSILLQYTGSAVNDDAQYFLAFTYFKREQYLLSAYEFSKLIRDTPASEFVQDAQYMLAESYYELSPVYQLEQSYSKKAIEEFQAFIEFFPTHPKVPEAEKKIAELYGKYAEKEYNAARIYERMEYYNAAIQYYENVKNTYFDSKFAPLAHYKLIELLILKERKDEALRNIAEYIKKYPNDERVAELQELNIELEKKANG